MYVENKIYDRKNDQLIEEKQYRQWFVNFLYTKPLGKILLPAITAPLFSKIYTIYDYLPFSKNKINSLVSDFNIDLSEYKNQDFRCFRDFFIRKKDIKVRCSKSDIISPADSKLLVYSIDEHQKIEVKNQEYELQELLEDKELANYFNGGLACVYRLSMNDYHRYVYVESGNASEVCHLRGKLHSIRDIALSRVKVFKENYRCYQIINHHGYKILQMEVGALLTGKIINHHGEAIKGKEKGYFDLGGSTIIILYPPNLVKIDDDIMKYSNQKIETKVEIGEVIGEYIYEKN